VIIFDEIEQESLWQPLNLSIDKRCLVFKFKAKFSVVSDILISAQLKLPFNITFNKSPSKKPLKLHKITITSSQFKLQKYFSISPNIPKTINKNVECLQ
jgi:hypothetical protein